MESPIIQAVILAIVQGITEFLPVSSSGHLVMAQHLLPGFNQPAILLDVLLHLGTLVSVLVYFRQDLWRMALTVLGRGAVSDAAEVDALPKPGWRLIMAIVLASAVTGPLALLIEHQVEKAFDSVRAVGGSLLITAVLLGTAHWLSRKRQDTKAPEDPGVLQSLIVGLAQGIAAVPGISRSGATISTGIMLGLKGTVAARFSFLIMLPAVGGATAYELFKNRALLATLTQQQIVPYIIGPALAGLVGILGIRLVMWVVSGKRLIWFALYCALVGCLAIVLG